jgi:transcriptional regulator with XRE-family HTH domain
MSESELSRAVRELRAHLGESQQAFSNRLGLSMATIVKYEAGREPTGRALAQLAHAAAEAGRHDLAYLFGRALVKELRLERLQLGIFSAPASPREDSPGVMVITFRGREAQNYARAFFETFGRLLFGTHEEQKRARQLLARFHDAALKEWRGRK